MSCEGTILFLAVRKRHPQRELEMGDAVGPSEPPGSTHSPLKEQIRAAPFFMHGRGTDEQAQKRQDT